ncbi:MAG: hypothetical protein JW892_03475 [Anaerolineae bacterium]|nr:hypothetical protein [Anaerolineae bacterium]
MKPLPKIVFCVVLLVSLVGNLLIATDKREIISGYASIALLGVLLFLVQKAREKCFAKPWQYHLARFFSIYLPFSLFLGWLPRLGGASLGVRLIISAILSAMSFAGIIFQESLWRNCDN